MSEQVKRYFWSDETGKVYPGKPSKHGWHREMVLATDYDSLKAENLEMRAVAYDETQRKLIEALAAERDALREALDSIKRYGLDTMSGPMEDPPDLAVWYRDGVREMVHRARAALTPSAREGM
jgi:hypothetical protein